MDSISIHSNLNVHNACIRLLHELDIQSNRDNPYAMPYANYIMSWANYIPINTIIIGQNPYPQNIYPEYGAAFAYSTSKCKYPPKTVQVISCDLYNYDNTDKRLSTECFKDSWRLLELGVILINETVFDKLGLNKMNTRTIKEMQKQNKALEILIAESFFAGQETVTCIGMGIPAASMTSIIRSWCPKDLIRMKVMTCKNPAARDIGDLPSHQVTIGKPAVSKVLSRIVSEYAKMPPPKVSQAEKRKQQNVDSLKKASENISGTGDAFENELKSFEDRLKAAQGGTNIEASVNDVLNSLGSLRRSSNNHRNAIASHTISMLMLIDSMPKNSGNTPSDSSNTANTQQNTNTTLPLTSGARRRPSTKVTPSSDSIQTVPETPEPSQEHIPGSSQGQSMWDKPMSATPSRGRRRPNRTSGYVPSDAGTEYTTTSTTAPLESKYDKDMSAAESVTMKCFANWCSENITDDPTYAEILNSAADELSTPNELSKSVLVYIRMRKDQNLQYDAYDELTDPDSESSVWTKANISLQK